MTKYTLLVRDDEPISGLSVEDLAETILTDDGCEYDLRWDDEE